MAHGYGIAECPTCKGWGVVKDSEGEEVTCPECDGDGNIKVFWTTEL